jgi:hypothetical protein
MSALICEGKHDRDLVQKGSLTLEDGSDVEARQISSLPQWQGNLQPLDSRLF